MRLPTTWHIGRHGSIDHVNGKDIVHHTLANGGVEQHTLGLIVGESVVEFILGGGRGGRERRKADGGREGGREGEGGEKKEGREGGREGGRGGREGGEGGREGEGGEKKRM